MSEYLAINQESMAHATLKNGTDGANSPHQHNDRLAVRTINHRLVVSTLEGTFLIPFHEIKYCSASGNYCTVTLESGKEVLLSKTLKFVQQQLPSRLFIRVHQSHLVNKDYVRFIGKDHLLLACEAKIPVSRSRRSHAVSTLLG
jgi:two-component system, LytTR family, response regulator